jgi:hypothetical protein
MRVSELFGIDRTQATLDFVDVDSEGDIPLFIDPRSIERLPSDWGAWALGLLRDYFERVLMAVKEERHDDGLALLGGLGEPNQTHLGLSTGQARGSGVGNTLAEDVWTALSQSEAAHTGLLEHLEDTALLIEGISSDRISDITTNVIREPLIVYTRAMAQQYNMAVEQVGSGSTWDYETGAWRPEAYVELPTTSTGSLLLVPKILVRQRLDLDPGEYYRKYILRHLMDRELAAGTALVHTLKSGRKRVYVKDVERLAKQEFGLEKRANSEVTLSQPDLLRQYKADKAHRTNQRPPMEHALLSLYVASTPPNWGQLMAAVRRVAPGNTGATAYHRAVESLLTALFYPTLTNPKIEEAIHEGRKRVDIRYTNIGDGGFFAWLQNNYPPMPYVFVECKNYSGEPGNPELDQLSGRFSEKRGNVGLLVCRTFGDKDLFVRRCRDTAADGRGFILPLDDSDLAALTTARRQDKPILFFRILDDRFSALVS